MTGDGNDGHGKRGKPRTGFPSFPTALGNRQRRDSHFPTAPTLYSNKKGEQQHPVGCANLQAHFTIGIYSQAFLTWWPLGVNLHMELGFFLQSQRMWKYRLYWAQKQSLPPLVLQVFPAILNPVCNYLGDLPGTVLHSSLRRSSFSP